MLLNRETHKNILIVQTAFLGDVILTTPLIINTKRLFPESRISVLSTPLGCQLLEGIKEIDSLIPYDKKGKDKGLLSFLSLTSKLRRESFDLCISPHRSFRTASFVLGACIDKSIGFDDASMAYAYKKRVKRNKERHEVERCLSLLEPFSEEVKEWEKTPYLAVSAEEAEKASQFLVSEGLENTGKIIALAPGSVWGTKKWPAEKYAAAAEMLSEEDNAQIILVGAPSDKKEGEAIARLCGKKVTDLTGRTSLRELVALIDRCCLLIGNDSAPGHIATARNVPVVSIFGPTIKSFGYTPYGRNVTVIEKELPCRPCHHHGPPECPEKHFRCMEEISPVEVVEAARKLLKAGGKN